MTLILWYLYMAIVLFVATIYVNHKLNRYTDDYDVQLFLFLSLIWPAAIPIMLFLLLVEHVIEPMCDWIAFVINEFGN